MMSSSAMIAIALVIFKFAVDINGFWETMGYEFAGAGIGALALLLFLSYGPRFKEAMENLTMNTAAILGTNEAIWIFARLSTFFAASLAPITLISIVGGIEPLIVFVVGTSLSVWFPNILKEDLDKSVMGLKIAAIILVFFGVWLINI